MTDGPDPIYLASRSPRRQELLAQIGIPFEEIKLRVAPGRHRDVVEEALDGEPALHYVERIARTKANTGWKRMQERGLPLRPVLGADTEVVQDDVIFGKPQDVAFVIGSADGLDAALKRDAEAMVALSSFTLPHGLVRVMMAEQLYRATSLNAGHPYHRE